MKRQASSTLSLATRFLLLCSPVGIITAILLAPFALPLLLGFGITLVLFWQAARLFTNGFVRFFDPAGYERMQTSGIDPFYNSIGAPLNTDSEQIRIHGFEPNSVCPECSQLVYLEADTPFRCPRCDAHWHENQWWKWDGQQWLLLT